ncbi:MAG TPA: hypothetical protein VEA59_05110 [Patescibacteria group bacterium]|nr:hypothetical protein [Patescibacteria group bacterium]
MKTRTLTKTEEKKTDISGTDETKDTVIGDVAGARIPSGDVEQNPQVLFRDRVDSGQQLARQLLRYTGSETYVFALPRGGVPIGFEIAKVLHAPLDVFIVRKIGAPDHEELELALLHRVAWKSLMRIRFACWEYNAVTLPPLLQKKVQRLSGGWICIEVTDKILKLRVKLLFW